MWLVYAFYRSFQQSFVGEDCVTNQNNVCVGGYHSRGTHSTLRAKKSDSCFARKIRRALPKFARYRTINCHWNRRDKKTRHFYLVPFVEGCYTRLQRRSLGKQCWNNVVTIRSNVTTMLRRCQLIFARVTQLLNSVLGNELGYIRIGLSALHDNFEVEIIRAVALLVPGDQLPGTKIIT